MSRRYGALTHLRLRRCAPAIPSVRMCDPVGTHLRLRRHAPAIFLSVFLGSAAIAQGQTPDPGGSEDAATPTTLIENEQTRIVRVDIKPNSTRSMHNHDDMVFHVFVTMADPIVLTIQGEKEPVKLGPWQTHFFKGGTTHAITNPSPRVAQFMEFFTKK